MTRVGVFGAGGRMGATVCAAVSADPELELVAAVDPAHAGERLEAGGLVAAAGPEAMAEAGAEVAVDFTVASAAAANAGLVRPQRRARSHRDDGPLARRCWPR